MTGSPSEALQEGSLLHQPLFPIRLACTMGHAQQARGACGVGGPPLNPADRAIGLRPYAPDGAGLEGENDLCKAPGGTLNGERTSVDRRDILHATGCLSPRAPLFGANGLGHERNSA
eukprot:15439011-Alexandrium_andersonii.AAC.1